MHSLYIGARDCVSRKVKAYMTLIICCNSILKVVYEREWCRRLAGAIAVVCASGCSTAHWGAAPDLVTPEIKERFAGSAGLQHAIVGFSVDTPQRAITAARQGIGVTILYGQSPPPGSALAKSLVRNHITVVDGGVSSELFYWECHRTHTVKPPPSGPNDYCRTDENPKVRSEAIVLRDVSKLLARDANRSYVV
ncbi:MAG: hypothetical protein JOZ58_17995, partial [Acetobacteraceae bacterium]|nr:hypothetical protein [Acetobacteraceae bacterium]